MHIKKSDSHAQLSTRTFFISSLHSSMGDLGYESIPFLQSHRVFQWLREAQDWALIGASHDDEQNHPFKKGFNLHMQHGRKS